MAEPTLSRDAPEGSAQDRVMTPNGSVMLGAWNSSLAGAVQEQLHPTQTVDVKREEEAMLAEAEARRRARERAAQQSALNERVIHPTCHVVLHHLCQDDILRCERTDDERVCCSL